MSGKPQELIHKAAAIILHKRRVLLCRKRGESLYITPGGKIEPGETSQQALARELTEELGITLTGCASLRSFEGSHNDLPNVIVKIETFLVETDGIPSAQAEIEEIRWIDSKYREEGIALSNINVESIIPFLLERDLID